MKYFKSKKNTVYLKDDCVVKEFRSSVNMETEFNVLQALDGNFSPRIIKKEGLKLTIEYINGELLLDKYLVADEESAIKLAMSLGKTVLGLRKILCDRIPNDENFRNYIIKDEAIFRVDFEETAQGTIECWLAKIMAFAMLYDVKLSVKKSFINTLTVSVPHSEMLSFEFEKELKFLANRWNVDFPKNDFSEIKKEME